MYSSFVDGLDHFNAATGRVLAALATLCLFMMLAIIIINVFLRYGLGAGFSWAEEASRYLMVWMAFLYFPTAHRQHLNVAVDILTTHLQNRRIGRWLVIGIEALVCIALFTTCYLAALMAIRADNTFSLALALPMPLVYAVMPVGMFLTALCALSRTLALLKSYLPLDQSGNKKSSGHSTAPRRS